MSGRRLLDAAALLKASRGVVAKHLTLRQQQLESYNKTSSVSKAVKSQTDRVTLTVKAASVLAERFNGPGPAYTSQASQSEWVARSVRNGDGESLSRDKENLRAFDNGERLGKGAAAEQPPSHDAKVGQETAQSHSKTEDGSTSTTSEVFNKANLNRNVGERDGEVNKGAESEQEELPEAAYAGIFQSPKVSRMLRGQYVRPDPMQEMELPGTKEMVLPNTKAAEATDTVHSSVRGSQQSAQQSSGLFVDPEPTSIDTKSNEDVEDIAADIAKDAESSGPGSTVSQANPVDIASTSPYEMRQSKVPSSRFGRLWQYGGLATSMAFGAVGESFRRATGSTQEAGGSLMLSEANMERLVSKLSKMRGAALKLGQMMSFQDSKMLPKPIHDVLQRVQDSADYMPPSQRDRVLSSNLGPEWRSLFSHFDENPIAAASIGQVHRATLASSSQLVAVKIQYPGVASSIDSDLSNLAILLTASRLLPKGLYLDKTIANARVELAWECDYVREAEMGTRFRNLLADDSATYHVPAVIKEASGQQVLTAEFVDGTGVTKGPHFTQDQRDWIGTNILRLCLREITEFKFMQTDPNWTNFLFNDKAHRLELLDFGASRDFPDKFILPYIRTLLAASRGDRNQVRDLSVELGYLTGHESQAMVNAHVSSVLTLAEPFAETAPELYDFRDQTITDRVRGFIPVMLRERLVPPPEETYSIHRKLSGAFLLCAKLGSRVRCREMFEESMQKAGISLS